MKAVWRFTMGRLLRIKALSIHDCFFSLSIPLRSNTSGWFRYTLVERPLYIWRWTTACIISILQYQQCLWYWWIQKRVSEVCTHFSRANNDFWLLCSLIYILNAVKMPILSHKIQKFLVKVPRLIVFVFPSSALISVGSAHSGLLQSGSVRHWSPLRYPESASVLYVKSIKITELKDQK